MRVRYLCVEEVLFMPEVGCYQTFGIAALQLEKDQCAIDPMISDISTDADFVRALAVRCNEGDLAPVHLRDVVEDALEDVPQPEKTHQ